MCVTLLSVAEIAQFVSISFFAVLFKVFGSDVAGAVDGFDMGAVVKSWKSSKSSKSTSISLIGVLLSLGVYKKCKNV